jgi:sporulation protein YlmC with PRC-barrel domain
MHLVRDVLDKELLDAEHEVLGRADGIVAEVRTGAPPRLVAIEAGAFTLARRIHPRLAAWLGRGWRGRLVGTPVRVPWSQVKEVGTEVIIDPGAQRDRLLAAERWMRDHVIRRIPGA